MSLISVSNNALQNITAVPASIPTGALTLIKSITASASASISFVHGTDGVVLDSTYSSYVFKFINVQPSNLGNIKLQFNMSTDSGSTYAVTKTSTFFIAIHNEADSYTEFSYDTGYDLAQSTAYQPLTSGIGNGADESASGTLTLYNPSSSVFVKHFISRTHCLRGDSQYNYDNFVSGYGNTTSAVDAINFTMTSGNIGNGIIKLYGVK